MKQNKILITIWILIFSLLFCSCGTSIFLNKNDKNTSTFYALDTIVTLTAYGEKSDAAFTAAKDECTRLENLFSTTIAESDVSKINSNPEKAHKVSPETIDVLKTAIYVSDKSYGAFDVSVYPLVKLWGFTEQSYKVPSQGEITHALSNVNYKNIDVDYDKNTVKLTDGMAIDFGAIAKGYISNCIVSRMKQSGVLSGIVNLGGNVQTFGTPPDKDKWSVAVELPQKDSNDYLAILSLAETSAITSGGYQRYFEKNNKTYHHIINPKTGMPAESGIISSTIICNNPALGDALSTAAYVLGINKTISLYNEIGGFDFVVLCDNNTVYISKGIEKDFILSDGYEDYKITVI